MSLKEIALLCFVLVGVGSSLPVVSDTFSTVQSYNGLDIGTHVYWAFEAPAPDSEGTRMLQFKSGNTDVDLQISVHFNSHVTGNLVELNSCTGGSWNGPVWCTGFPFTVGEWNNVLVVVGEDNYEVIVKGTGFSCKYDHYTPPESVETAQATHGKVEFARVLKNYEPGRVILINGKTTRLEGHPLFNVVLSDLDPNTYSPINLQFSLYKPNTLSQVVFITKLKNTPKQREIIIPENPFIVGEEFTIIIICQTYGYEIIINGAHFATFKHRIPFNEEMRIAVWGTEVNKIEYY